MKRNGVLRRKLRLKNGTRVSRRRGAKKGRATKPSVVIDRLEKRETHRE